MEAIIFLNKSNVSSHYSHYMLKI